MKSFENAAIIDISEGWGFCFVCDLCSAVKRRKLNAKRMRENKQFCL